VTRTLAYEGQGKWQIYAGGYSDMVAQRGVGVQARKAEKAAKAKSKSTPDTSPQKSTSNKLSYKHKFRLESLPTEMDALESEISALNTTLADPELYSKNPDAFNAKSKALVTAQEKLSTCEEEWLELEMLREAAEG